MKRILIFAMLLAAFYGCKKEEEEDMVAVDYRDVLVGTYSCKTISSGNIMGSSYNTTSYDTLDVTLNSGRCIDFDSYTFFVTKDFKLTSPYDTTGNTIMPSGSCFLGDTIWIQYYDFHHFPSGTSSSSVSGFKIF